jgi:hypothetical protein
LTGCVVAAHPQSPAAPAGAPPPPPQVTTFTAEPHGLTLRTTTGAVSITAVNDHVIRVRASRDGNFGKDFSWAVVQGANAPTGTLTVKDEGASILAATPDVHVRIASRFSTTPGT